MPLIDRKDVLMPAFLAASLLASAPAVAHSAPRPEPLVVGEQGSFAVGGTVTTAPGTFNALKPLKPDGQTFHGDHLYTFYQVPVNPRKYPIVMWHGFGQFSKTWETTPDGREGFQNIFLRRRFATYLVDQPRRGDAGRSTVEATIKPTPDEQFWFGQFRVGIWPNYFDGVQFDNKPETLNQYFRAMTPNIGPFDANLISDTAAALFAKIGPGILMTHSQSGGPGWLTAIKSQNVKAIIAFEPGSGFLFPEGELPQSVRTSFDTVEGVPVPVSDFMALTKVPIIIFYGDFIPEKPTEVPTQDAWRGRLKMARIWRDTVNKHGGQVTLVHLPEVGIRGNTHFPFSDLNNVEIADQVSKFFAERGLD
jgi:hypothetical protein